MYFATPETTRIWNIVRRMRLTGGGNGITSVGSWSENSWGGVDQSSGN